MLTFSGFFLLRRPAEIRENLPCPTTKRSVVGGQLLAWSSFAAWPFSCTRFAWAVPVSARRFACDAIDSVLTWRYSATAPNASVHSARGTRRGGHTDTHRGRARRSQNQQIIWQCPFIARFFQRYYFPLTWITCTHTHTLTSTYTRTFDNTNTLVTHLPTHTHRRWKDFVCWNEDLHLLEMGMLCGSFLSKGRDS